MQTITGIRAAKGRPDRYEILVNEAVAGVLSVREIAELGIREGLEVGTSLGERVRDFSERLRVYDRALAMLARAPRSAFDLRQRLIAKGESSFHAAWAAARLEEEGYLNDETYASQFARARLARGMARSIVLNRLLRARVQRTTAERAIAAVAEEDGHATQQTVLRLAERKLRSLRSVEPAVARRRLVGFLRRRGYGTAEIRDALDQLRSDDSTPGQESED